MNGLLVLDGVSVQLDEGEFVTVVGPSGCGKTTFFNVLIGLATYDGGEIVYEGRGVENLRGLVAYMQQRDLLLPWRTLMGNVLIGPEIQGELNGETLTRAKELLSFFRLDSFSDMYPSQLSGGMRQRAALARTLMFGKDLLLLDEPLSALDAITRRKLQSYLLALSDRFGKSVLMITHDVEEALLLSDRIYVFSALPARVRRVIKVEMEKPRSIADRRFLELKEEILDELLEEVQNGS
ncbi:MAG: ABC transporter ATP-binding protein [Candidatus Hydrothermae bacterium]|nr:ABC transporter ATP-binding protein [Candidatus Hydrothermae bacterium]